MSTQHAVTATAGALREFLGERLSQEEVAQASKLIASYVAAAVNDRPRILRERQEAEARREAAIQDAKDHHARTTGRNLGDVFSQAFGRRPASPYPQRAA